MDYFNGANGRSQRNILERKNSAKPKEKYENLNKKTRILKAFLIGGNLFKK
jgi:hypothetical protein